MDHSPHQSTRPLPGAPRKRSNSLPVFGPAETPRKDEAKSAVSPFTLSAHKRKEEKIKAARQAATAKLLKTEDDDDADEQDGNQEFENGEVDESFFDLLKTFANMDLPDEGVLEQCPLCPLKLSLANFAKHVYECIKQLEPEEKKEQIRLDEQLALKLSEGDPGQIADQQLALELSGQFDFQAPSKGSPCKFGSNCRRYDASHHQWFSHPLVPCPICTEEFTVCAIDAHVSLCLETGPPQVTYFTGPSSSAAFGSFNSSAPFGSSFSAPSAFSTSTALSSAPFQGESFAAPRFGGRQEKKVNNEKSKTKKKYPKDDEEADDDDDAGDDEDEDDLPPLIAPAPLVIHPSAPSPKGPLSRAQMRAMAQVVIGQKSKPASQQDVSLVSLLETFRGLGFTKEALSQEINKDKQMPQTPTPSAPPLYTMTPAPVFSSSPVFSSVPSLLPNSVFPSSHSVSLPLSVNTAPVFSSSPLFSSAPSLRPIDNAPVFPPAHSFSLPPSVHAAPVFNPSPAPLPVSPLPLMSLSPAVGFHGVPSSPNNPISFPTTPYPSQPDPSEVPLPEVDDLDAADL